MTDEDNHAPQLHGNAQGREEGAEQAVDHHGLGHGGTVDAEDAHQHSQQGEAHLPGGADQRLQQLEKGIKGTGLGDKVQEGVKNEEHEEQPHHFSAALHHAVKDGANGHSGKQTCDDRSHDHHQDHEGCAAIGGDPIDHHQSHSDRKGDGGAAGGRVHLEVLRSGLPVRAEVLRPLGLLLDFVGDEEGAHPHDDGYGQSRTQQKAGIGEPGDAHQGHHRRGEGAEEQSGLTGALEDDGQRGGSDAHRSYQRDHDGGDHGVGTCQSAQQGDQHHGTDHGGDHSPLLGTDADLPHQHIDDGGGYACLSQHHAQS